jgi:hypothetical protein
VDGIGEGSVFSQFFQCGARVIVVHGDSIVQLSNWVIERP